MNLDPQWIIAGCALAGLGLTWTTSVAGIAFWVVKRIDGIKREILEDFQLKHEENTRKVAALETLVIRHDTILDPEFSSNGKISGRGRQ